MRCPVDVRGWAIVACPPESSEIIPDTHGGVCRLLYSLLYSLRGFNPFSSNDLSWVSSPQNTGRFSPKHGALLPKTRGASPQNTGRQTYPVLCSGGAVLRKTPGHARTPLLGRERA